MGKGRKQRGVQLSMSNEVILGDNLYILQGIESNTVDLVYLDPPFNTGRDFGQFSDKWAGGGHPLGNYHSETMGAYLAFIEPRLLELKRLLKDTGSIYLHCDPTASHYLKLLMDSIFGKNAFANEISWKRFSGRRAPLTPKRFPSVVDNILFYKMDNAEFSLPFLPLDPAYVKRMYKYDDNDGKGRYRFGGRIYDRKYYLNNSRGNAVTTWWDDITELQSNSAERIGYPTQKPIKLLSRIIEASSNKGDLVLDPFCGAGTTLVAARQLGRNYIGIDSNPEAIRLTNERLQNE